MNNQLIYLCDHLVVFHLNRNFHKSFSPTHVSPRITEVA